MCRGLRSADGHQQMRLRGSMYILLLLFCILFGFCISGRSGCYRSPKDISREGRTVVLGSVWCDSSNAVALLSLGLPVCTFQVLGLQA